MDAVIQDVEEAWKAEPICLLSTYGILQAAIKRRKNGTSNELIPKAKPNEKNMIPMNDNGIAKLLLELIDLHLVRIFGKGTTFPLIIQSFMKKVFKFLGFIDFSI